MICMLSIFVFLGHGPIILAAALLGNNDLLMLTSHLLSFKDNLIFLWAVHCQYPNNQLVSFYPIPFWFFKSREGLAYNLDIKQLISPKHRLLARIQPGSNVIKCNPDNVRTQDNTTYAIPSPNTCSDKSMMAVSKENP